MAFFLAKKYYLCYDLFGVNDEFTIEWRWKYEYNKRHKRKRDIGF